MNTQQRRAQNCGSDKLTEELEGFCNKPIHSVGLKYLPIPHSQGQLYFGLTFYMAFDACLKAGVQVCIVSARDWDSRDRGWDSGAITYLLKGVLAKSLKPPESQLPHL